MNVIEKEKCCGCGACYTVCPQNCIAMQTDKEGFEYPQIDKARCIGCNLCKKVCPILHKPAETSVQSTCSAYNKDASVRKESSSGGVFTALAMQILQQGGVVFGAAFDNTFQVRHICVDKAEDIKKLRSSKYMQSKIGDCYKQAQKFLKEKRPVLFTGTPCQIAGLKAYLNKAYDTLYTQNIICHGVPSPAVWEKYLAFVSQGNAVREVKFRSKESGWKKYRLKIIKGDNSTYGATVREDPYLKAFVRNLSLRPSCGNCAFKSYDQIADITLADYWGVEQIEPAIDDDGGLSLLFINSAKGEAMLSGIKKEIVCKEADMQKAVLYNQSLVKASLPHKKRAYFFKNIDRYSFDVLVEQCLQSPAAVKAAQKILCVAKRVKNKAKRMLYRKT